MHGFLYVKDLAVAVGACFLRNVDKLHKYTNKFVTSVSNQLPLSNKVSTLQVKKQSRYNILSIE